MSAIQLERDSTGRLPYLSRWAASECAKYDGPVVNKSDQWAKSKHQDLRFTVVDRDHPGRAFQHSRQTTNRHTTNVTIKEPPPVENVHIIDGRLRNFGVKSFTDMMLEELHWIPGSMRYPVKELKYQQIRTAAYDRAKQGYVYWYEEGKKCEAKKWTGMAGNPAGLLPK